jgi:hypothetical protein
MSVNKNSISIVTVTKNPNIEWLNNAMSSVVNQNNQICQYIIVDASDEKEAKQIEQMCKKYNAEYHSQLTTGLWEAFSEAFDLCKGEIIGIINSDDYIENDCLKIIKSTFEQNDCDFIYGNSRRVDSNGNELYIHKPLNLFLPKFANFLTFNVSHHTLYFKKDILKEIQFIDEKFDNHFDLVFINKLFNKFNSKYIPSVLANFRIWGGNASTNSYKSTSEVFAKTNNLVSWLFFIPKVIHIITNISYLKYLLFKK